jgi:hypothetical protein
LALKLLKARPDSSEAKLYLNLVWEASACKPNLLAIFLDSQRPPRLAVFSASLLNLQLKEDSEMLQVSDNRNSLKHSQWASWALVCNPNSNLNKWDSAL